MHHALSMHGRELAMNVKDLIEVDTEKMSGLPSSQVLVCLMNALPYG